eukprot:2725374-Prymnesium_polylepis.1
MAEAGTTAKAPPSMADDMTPEERAYYNSRRSDIEKALSAAASAAVVQQAGDPLDAMIKELQRRKLGADSSSALKERIDLAVANAKVEVDKMDHSGALDWKMDKWIKQLSIQDVSSAGGAGAGGGG